MKEKRVWEKEGNEVREEEERKKRRIQIIF